MCIKGPPKPYLPVPRSCYPCRPPPRASTSPATAAALLPMGEPRPPRPPASRALRRLPPPPLLLLSGSALRTRRPTLPSHPRHRAANPPTSTPLPLFLLRSASCSLSLVEGRGHRLLDLVAAATALSRGSRLGTWRKAGRVPSLAAGADSGPLLAAPPRRGAHPIAPLLRSG